MKIAPNNKKNQRRRRHRRVRAKIQGSKKRPRATIFRSNQHIYVQLIDDQKAATVLSFSDLGLGTARTKGKNKTEVSKLVGQNLGELAKKSGIGEVIFDRGGYRYHGRVRAVAEGLRASGLKL